MKRVSNEDITLAGATSRGVSAKQKWRGRKAETIFFAETSRDVAPASVIPPLLTSFIYYNCFIAMT
jgi:hypothetical protein